MAFFDDLTEHPDYIDLEVAGKEVPFLLTKAAIEEAKEKGVDIQAFQDLKEEDVEGNLDALSSLIWMGTLPFDQGTPSKEELDAVITPRVAAQVGPRVMAQFEGLSDEELDDVVGKA